MYTQSFVDDSVEVREVLEGLAVAYVDTCELGVESVGLGGILGELVEEEDQGRCYGVTRRFLVGRGFLAERVTNLPAMMIAIESPFSQWRSCSRELFLTEASMR